MYLLNLCWFWSKHVFQNHNDWDVFRLSPSEELSQELNLSPTFTSTAEFAGHNERIICILMDSVHGLLSIKSASIFILLTRILEFRTYLCLITKQSARIMVQGLTPVGFMLELFKWHMCYLKSSCYNISCFWI